jgi:hypothetical protein
MNAPSWIAEFIESFEDFNFDKSLYEATDLLANQRMANLRVDSPPPFIRLPSCVHPTYESTFRLLRHLQTRATESGCVGFTAQ